MDIKDIKAKLSILEVLQHYGLWPDKNDRLKCPFHPDKTPSFQVYPKTNTFCCFSSNCQAGTGDAIQFIELYEKCTKHDALKKATGLAGGEATTPTAPATMFIETGTLTKSAVLSKAFTIFKNSLPRNPKAVQYSIRNGVSSLPASYNRNWLPLLCLPMHVFLPSRRCGSYDPHLLHACEGANLIPDNGLRN